MTEMTLRFYRLATTTSSNGESTTEQVEIRPSVHFVSIDPAPGTEIRTWGFADCRCPQAPACHAREKKLKGLGPVESSRPPTDEAPASPRQEAKPSSTCGEE
jgi:hypothetical protein